MASSLKQILADVECIATFQSHQKHQETFTLTGVPLLQFNCETPPNLIRLMEKKIVSMAISYLQQDCEDLVKLSLCYSAPILETFQNEKEVEDGGFGYIVRSNGKYYFQPDQRDEITMELCNKDPFLAKNTLPYLTWLEMNKNIYINEPV